MSSTAHVASSGDALCCCEYQNRAGEKSHIMATCCDCEAVDTACDRCMTCQGISSDLCDAMSRTCLDRWRIPWCSGKGAVRIDPEVGIPLITIPSAIFLATINATMTCIMMAALPFVILAYYRAWTRKQKKPRTKIFYMSGLVSVWLMLFIFLFVVTGFRKILLWEIMLLLTVFLVMMYALYQAKKDPGSVKNSPYYGSESSFQNSSQANSVTHNQTKDSNSKNETVVEVDSEEQQAKDLLINNFGLNEYIQRLEDRSKELKLISEHSIPEEQVTWVDSRPIRDGKLRMWCPDCQAKCPPRSGHCPVCHTCILGRDHHCVWIDNCIGASNHRAFVSALVLFVFGGYYGSHLTLTTVCTPEMYLDWFLLPSDCRFVYADFPTALAFVGCIYSSIASTGMLIVLFNQILLISQNITSQELHTAYLRGWTSASGLGTLSFSCCASHNTNNHGCLLNWKNFITGDRQKHSSYQLTIL